MSVEIEALNYAERVCNGIFPIEYTREQVVNHTKEDFIAGAVFVNKMLREFIMRANYAFPMNEQDLEWFESGTDAKTEDGRNFLLRLYNISGLEAEAREEDFEEINIKQ